MNRFFLAWSLLLAGIVCFTQQPQAYFQSRLQVAISGGGSPSVTVDQVGCIMGGTPPLCDFYAAGSSSFSVSNFLTITAALTGPALVCAISRDSASLDTNAGLAMTWNGVSMPHEVFQQNTPLSNNTVAIFGLRNPASGSHTLAVTATNAAVDNFVNCMSFSNVNQTSDAAAFPNSTGNTGGITSVTVTSASGHYVVGSFNGNNGTLLGSTLFFDNQNGSIINAFADYVSSSGSSTSVGSSAIQVSIIGMDVSN